MLSLITIHASPVAHEVAVVNTTTTQSASDALPTGLTSGAVRSRAPEELLPWLPCTLALEVPVVAFSVDSLSKLKPGSLVRTSCHQSAEIPLQVNGVAMAWTEFELVADSLAARITDLI